MSGASDPYVPVYYTIVTDERFRDVYSNDKALAAWLRLLLTADGTYPAPAPLPRHVSTAALDLLVTAGLVELVGRDYYVIHGLKAERERRSDRARQGAEARWGASYGNAVAMLPQSDSNAGAMLKENIREEQNITEQRGGLTAPETGPDVWEWVTMRRPNKSTQPDLWAWLTRLCEEYGSVRLWEVMRVCAAQDRSRQTLVSRTEAVLSRDADRDERMAESVRLAEKRKPVVIQPKPEETAEERERRETAFSKMRENVKQIGIA
jgi:hypothetical protein